MTTRQPKGIPVGGQFAESRKPDGGDLATSVDTLPPPVASSTKGIWDIEHASKPKPIDRGNGIISTSFNLSGEPSANTDISARIAAYEKPNDLDEKIADAIASNEPVTVLSVGDGAFGGSFPRIVQGKLFRGRSGDVAFLPTGKRTQGFKLKTPLDIISDKKPASITELNRRWYEGTGIPPTEPLTLEMLRGASEENPIALIYTHPGFDGEPTPGCVWYIDYYEEDEDQEPGTGIAGGYMWAPDDHGLTSEHGSTYAKEILTKGAVVPLKPGVNFKTMTELPEDRAGAYKQLFGGADD
jgi:hypothetical protein